MKLNLDKVNDKLLALKIPFADYGVVNSDEVLSEGTFENPYFRKVPHPKDRIYRMASMTKPITAYLALVVLNEKGINLNDEVGTFLPEIDSLKICRKRNNVIEYIKNDVPITFHQLLNCTSGHAYEHHDPIISDLISKKLLASMKDGDEAFLEAPLVFKPGSKWGYGISYGWLGKALSAITKKSLNNILDKYLCQPLQLKNTSFELKTSDREKLVPVYIQGSDGSYSCISSKINLGLNTFQYGGGGLTSTINEYLKILQFFLKNFKNEQQFSPLKLMLQSQIQNLEISPLKSYNKKMILDYNIYPDINKTWGYGLMINNGPLPYKRSAKSGSWAGVLNTYFWIDPRSNLAGAILMQALPCYGQNFLNAFDFFERYAYKK